MREMKFLSMVAALTGGCLAGSAVASHVSVTGAISVLSSSPSSVEDGALIGDTPIYLFAEKQGVVLPQELTFNVTQPGTLPLADGLGTTPGDLPAGARVNSYYVHFQSLTGTRSNPVLASGTVHFDADILGIAVFDRRLSESDHDLGLETTVYPAVDGRELDINGGGVFGIEGSDRVTLMDDRRTLLIDLGNTGGLDQLRIVTSVGLELIGDANLDCTVGAADYAIWAAQFGQTGEGLSADFDGNGSVGAGDYALWAANFGNTCPPEAAAVPEPATWVLALGALGTLLVWRGLARPAR